MSARRKDFKHGKSKFVMLNHWLLDSLAWKSLGVGPRALYMELKRKFNGSNNGDVFLSQRDAAKALNCDKDTAGRYFAQLVSVGFICKTQNGYLGPSGRGLAAKWALTEEPVGSQLPTKDFMRKPVGIQNPVPEMGTPRRKNGDTSISSRHPFN